MATRIPDGVEMRELKPAHVDLNVGLAMKRWAVEGATGGATGGATALPLGGSLQGRKRVRQQHRAAKTTRLATAWLWALIGRRAQGD